ncbi:MAG: FG-GAP repeat protein [Proteobacteria bacterium]|nr:FG-GAP repeat protein [Pseudomonadota bacterium]
MKNDTTVQFPPLVQLSALNGENGFKIDGEGGNSSGYSVSAAGDVNGDGYVDIVIGVPYYSISFGTYEGRIYVVFGGSGVGDTGLLSLSSLNGTNGFKIDAEYNGYLCSGYSVSAADDVNGDEYADIVIGAPYYGGSSGRVYVVYGGPAVGKTGLFPLSSLNGTNGFKLDGEKVASRTYPGAGWSVNTAGDMNSDGFVDLVIGDPNYKSNNSTGRSYVVFGGTGVGSTGLFALSSLNGTNGFKLDGEVNSYSGVSVSGVGDLNGDGYADLLVGGPTIYANGNCSYVVFGAPGIGNAGSIPLSSLNGINGFKIQAEAPIPYNPGGAGGISVNKAGDINGDNYADFVIGVPSRSYVVFGGPKVGQDGLVLLSSLNGTNGFKIDQGGYSVNTAGDINNDGYVDLLIGAPDCSRSFVVFGGPEVGKTGLVALSGLNGVNGFELDGEYNGYSGWSVSAAGDINSDGFADLLIGALINNSYVVFGDALPQPTTNQLTIHQNQTWLLTNQNLNASIAGYPDAAVSYIISNLQHGWFSLVNNSQQPITRFNQSQLAAGQIQFSHDGGTIAPAYTVQVQGKTFAMSQPQNASVTFYRKPFALNNSLWINQGQTLFLNPSMLGVVDDYPPDQVNFTVIDLQHGRFQIFPQNNTVNQFTFQQLLTSQVMLVQDNSTDAPGYQIVVNDPYFVLPESAAQITFYRQLCWISNQLSLIQGDKIILNASDLSVFDDHPDEQVIFGISQLQHGQFQLLPQNNSIIQFNRQQLTGGKIMFAHDGSTAMPGYQISVSDGYFNLTPQSALINFDTIPVLLNNSLRIDQGQKVILQSENFCATQPLKDDSVLIFTVSGVEHGNFSFLNATHQSIFSFRQLDITAGAVGFIHDNTTQTPAYSVSVTDGWATTQPKPALIDFDASPVLLNNILRIGQGQTVYLTSENFSATHPGGEDADLNFIVDNIEHGNFLFNGQSTVVFSQLSVENNQVSFSHDDSLNPPSYTLSVSDGRITTAPVESMIQFDVKPILKNNQLFLSRGQKLILSTENILASHNDTDSDDLQFLLSQVTHGQFEQLSQPGIMISQFIQKNLKQQQIVFVHDNSTQAPSYQIKVSDGWMDSDVTPSTTLLAISEPWPVNQGQKFVITPDFLNVVSDSLTVDQIYFTVTEVQQAQFETISNPGHVLMEFNQQQVSQGNIVLSPDGTSHSPQCSLMVSDQNRVYGAWDCPVIFDIPPLLENAYLQTAPGIAVTITKFNLKASTNTSITEKLVFQISNLAQGYFANNDNWGIPLLNFTQQDVIDNQIIFFTDESGKLPHFDVSVWDGRMHCQPCPQPVKVVFKDGAGTDSSFSDLVKHSLIGALISGGVGLLFFALKWYINYKHVAHLQRGVRPTIDGVEQGYSDSIVLPIAREIFSRIKIGGCLGYISQGQYNEYVGAVTLIVAALETRGIINPDNWHTLTRSEKQRITEAIAAQTREIVGNTRCCSPRTFTSIYKAEATAKMLRDKVASIVIAVQESLSEEKEIKTSRSSFNFWRSEQNNVSINQNPASDLSLRMIE